MKTENMIKLRIGGGYAECKMNIILNELEIELSNHRYNDKTKEDVTNEIK